MFSARAAVLILLAVGAGEAFRYLMRTSGDLSVARGGVSLAGRFLARALSPALTYESQVPDWTPPLLLKAVTAAHSTIVFAAAAMSLALVGGAMLAFAGSSAWWADDPAGRGVRKVGRFLRPGVYAASRTVAAFVRSIHELLWAVLLLAAFGLGQLTAVLAIAIPYAGVLGKVFAEMIDEVPRQPAAALRDAGASPLQIFFFGLLPRALPDMAAYAFYRFECAIRSSAVLGFFGFPTLGYYIAASFENLLFGEVWTYLYVLFAIVAAMDWWSGALRRRFVV